MIRYWLYVFLAVVFVFLVMVCFGHPASAHTRSESHTSWVMNGQTIYLTYTVPELEAKRVTASGDSPPDKELGDYLLAHLTVTAGDKPCPSIGKIETESAVAGFRKLDFTFDCPDTKSLTIGTSAFFDLVPTHVNLAQIQTSDGEFVEQMFTADRQTLSVSGEGSENRLQNAGFLEYVQMGIMHIFTGLDHQSFLLGLVLISRRFRDLAFVITGFTLGHSATLALAVTGIIRPHAEYIDALVALTIALIGAENVAVSTHKPESVIMGGAVIMVGMILMKLAGFGTLPMTLLMGAGIFGANYLMISGHLRDAGRIRLVVTLVFGLIHGFGFASDLLQLRLPTGRLAELLVGFNLGVEIGQLTLVTAVVGLVYLLRKVRLTLPRPLVVDVGSAFLIGLGMYWFISRSFA